jgi:integrase
VVADYEANGRRALGEIRRHRDRLVAYFGATRDAATLTSGDIDAYAEARRRATDDGRPSVAVATVNRELACLRRGLRLAYRKGRLAAIPAVVLAAEHNTRTGFFEPGEVAALLAASPVEWRTLWSFLHLTGWRTGEARALTWAQVDFGAGVLRLEPGTTKNGDGRTFPFAARPALATVLVNQREATRAVERQTGRIIPSVFHVAGAPIDKHDIRRAWRQATRAAGLRGKLPHDFRRTAVRNLERAGVPRSVAMKLTGHKTESVYRRYAIVAEADLAEGVAKLATLASQAPATVLALRSATERTGL